MASVDEMVIASCLLMVGLGGVSENDTCSSALLFAFVSHLSDIISRFVFAQKKNKMKLRKLKKNKEKFKNILVV